MLRTVTFPMVVQTCIAVTSFESLIGTCIHALVSRLALTRMTDLLVELLERCEDGYMVCQREVALVFPYVSIYGSCSNSRS